jgi:CubicO group peptidase (beta-lactamase class C family)
MPLNIPDGMPYLHLHNPLSMKSWCLLCLFIIGFVHARGQDLQTLAQERVDSKETPGIIIGIYDHGKIHYYVAGYADVASQSPVTSTTLFEIGSITKTFTTTLLALDVEMKTVALEDPIQKYLPETVKVPTREGKVITFFDLATAHSGLPRMPTNFAPGSNDDPYIDYTEEKMFSFLSGYTLPRNIGEQYEYSNLGMGLLGATLAREHHTTYRELVTRNLLKPLKMHNTWLNMPDQKHPHVATGYAGSNPVHAWTWSDQSALQSAGGLLSTAEDMMKYAVANLEPSSKPLGKAMVQAHRARSSTTRETTKIGLGWHITGETVWHNGGTGGFRSFLGFSPGSKKAIIILTNSGTGADDIGFHWLDNTQPLKTIRKPVTLSADILQAYPGNYQISIPSITVTLKDGQLYGQMTGQPAFELYAESKDHFFLTVVDAQIEFTRNASGEVIGLILHQGGNDVKATRTK